VRDIVCVLFYTFLTAGANARGVRATGADFAMRHCLVRRVYV